MVNRSQMHTAVQLAAACLHIRTHKHEEIGTYIDLINAHSRSLGCAGNLARWVALVTHTPVRESLSRSQYIHRASKTDIDICMYRERERDSRTEMSVLEVDPTVIK